MTRDVRELLRQASEGGPDHLTGARAAMERGMRLRWRRRLQIALSLGTVLVLLAVFALSSGLKVFQVGDITPIGPGETSNGPGQASTRPDELHVDATTDPESRRTDPGSRGLPEGETRAPVTGVSGATVATIGEPGGGRVAFVSTRDGNTEIYTMDAGGEGQRRLTNSPFADESPTWSPDGSRIAFSSNRSGDYEIYTMRADGADVRRVGRVDGEQAVSPVWSPDGRRFAFVSFEEKTQPMGPHRIWVMNVDGAAQRALTHGGNELSPAWSPDGRRVAYSGAGGIHVVDSDGSNVRWVHEGALPAWSPDGRRIALITGRDDSDGQALVVIDSDGTGARALLKTTDEWLGHPSWSPNGGVIAFDRDPDGHRHPLGCGITGANPECVTTGQQPSAIWMIDADGTELRRLSGPADDYDATFSPPLR